MSLASIKLKLFFNVLYVKQKNRFNSLFRKIKLIFRPNFLCKCSIRIETKAKLQPMVNKKKAHLISSRDKTCASFLGLNSKSKVRTIRGVESISKLSQCLSIPDSIRTLLLWRKKLISKSKLNLKRRIILFRVHSHVYHLIRIFVILSYNSDNIHLTVF